MAHNLLLPIIGRWTTETKKGKTCSRKGNFLNVYFASILKFWSSTLNLNWDPYERQKRCRLAAVVYTFNRSLLVRMLKYIFIEQEIQVIHEVERTEQSTKRCLRLIRTHKLCEKKMSSPSVSMKENIRELKHGRFWVTDVTRKSRLLLFDVFFTLLIQKVKL